MRLSVSLRLNLFLSAAVGAALVIAVLLLNALGQLSDRSRELLDGPVRDQALAREMQVVFKKQVQEWKNILLRGAVARDRARYVAAFREDRGIVLALADSLQHRVRDTLALEELRVFRGAYATLDSGYVRALDRFEQADGRNPFAVDSMMRGQDREPTNRIDAIVLQLGETVTSAVTASDAAVSRQRRSALLGVVALMALLLAIPPLVGRTIVTPLRRMQVATAEIAAGNLSTDLAHRSADELGDLADSFRSMSASLRALLGDVRGGAARVSQTSSSLNASAEEVNDSMLEVAQAASAIAQAAADQTRSVTDALEATNMVAERAQAIARDAVAAGVAAHGVASRATEGREASAAARHRLAEVLESTDATVPAIQSLSEKTRGIRDFTDVVAGIATQSKLLALNAAIEAARAGNHGRGFGVVADEVGKLARDSQDALERIRSLTAEVADTGQTIGERVQQVRAAVREGDEAFRRLDRTLTEIDTEAQRSAESVRRIDTSTREQEARSSALALLMETMAAGAEENAATAQQLSASNQEQAAALQSIALGSADLRDIAQRLDSSVARFKLDEVVVGMPLAR